MVNSNYRLPDYFICVSIPFSCKGLLVIIVSFKKATNMLTHNLGYPRIGSHRELKKASEMYWSGKRLPGIYFKSEEIFVSRTGKLQKEAGIDLIPSNDFSFYDQVLDMSLTVGAIPQRYHDVILNKKNSELDLYFAMARGYQKDGLDITALEMTKWFDTNYHYMVPEFHRDQVSIGDFNKGHR